MRGGRLRIDFITNCLITGSWGSPSRTRLTFSNTPFSVGGGAASAALRQPHERRRWPSSRSGRDQTRAPGLWKWASSQWSGLIPSMTPRQASIRPEHATSMPPTCNGAAAQTCARPTTRDATTSWGDGPGAATSVCLLGSDCNDCGPRMHLPSLPPLPRYLARLP